MEVNIFFPSNWVLMCLPRLFIFLVDIFYHIIYCYLITKQKKMDSSDCYLITKQKKMDWLWSKKVIKNGRHIWIPPTMPIDQTNQTSKLLKRFMMKAICDCFSFTSHCYPIQKTNSYQRDRTTPILGREYYAAVSSPS